MPSNNNKKSNSRSSKQDYTMLAFLGLLVVLFGAYYLATKSNSETNTIDTFENGEPNLQASNGEVIVALFYADWCPHCVSFKPDYKKAMSELTGNEHKGKTLRFVMVDCDKHKTLAKENDVSGFPTVKILNDDGSSEEYDGERSFEGLSSYFD
jgi:thiol-disulfide isomerase/thioredoxin